MLLLLTHAWILNINVCCLSLLFGPLISTPLPEQHSRTDVWLIFAPLLASLVVDWRSSEECFMYNCTFVTTEEVCPFIVSKGFSSSDPTLLSIFVRIFCFLRHASLRRWMLFLPLLLLFYILLRYNLRLRSFWGISVYIKWPYYQLEASNTHTHRTEVAFSSLLTNVFTSSVRVGVSNIQCLIISRCRLSFSISDSIVYSCSFLFFIFGQKVKKSSRQRQIRK